MHFFGTNRFRLLGLVALAVLLLNILPTGGTGGATPVVAQPRAEGPCTRVEDFREVPGMGPACRLPNGRWKVRLRDGTSIETHGPDTRTIVRPARPSAGIAAVSSHTCVFDLDNDYYGLMIYAYGSDLPNRFATEEATIRSQFQEAQDLLNEEAGEFGTQASYKMACNPDGTPRVVSVQLATPNTTTTFSSLQSDLRALGYNNPRAKYWVWYDGYPPGSGLCGIGDMYVDDSAGVNNLNNGNGTAFFAAIFQGCWGASTIMHEVGHNLGAVQLSAPNTSGGLHCNDGRDIMCYSDGGSSANYNPNVCTDKPSHFDCNHNDYFHPNPAVGSYLANHWNLAACANRYISRTGCNDPELPPGDKLSQNKPATADSSCTASQGPDKAVDGSVASGSKWCSTGSSKWLRIDLGASARITGFLLKHAGAGGESVGLNTRDFNIQLSPDGTNWTTALTVAGNIANAASYRITTTPARYVRLNVTTPSNNGDTSARIYELEVYGLESLAGSNLALNKAATADSTCSATEGPEKAVDGTLFNNSKWCSFGGTRWLQIDLGANASITGFYLWHAGAGGETTAYNTRDFDIQLSTNASTWSTPVTVSGNTASVTRHAITTTTARYVRLNVTTPTNNGDPAARIFELEVYGTSTGGTPTNTPTRTATPTVTRTPTRTATPTRTPTPGAGGLKIQYAVGDPSGPNDNQIMPLVKIVNTGGSSVPLNELTIRYWYTRDTAIAQTANCDFFPAGCANLTTSFVAVSPARTGADYYYQVGFTSGAGSIAAGGNSGEIKTRFNKTNWSNYTESGDYSYDATKTTYADWNKVTLYRNGVLVWGTEP